VETKERPANPAADSPATGGALVAAGQRLAAALAPGRQDAAGRRPALLPAIRGGSVAALACAADPARVMAAAALSRPRRPRMVLAIDATASRERAWSAAKQVTDSMFLAVPGGLDVALAVHSGGRMTLFSPFHPDAGALRDDAASVICRAGKAVLLDILARTRDSTGVKVVVYVGDNFEEDHAAGMAAADALRARGTRLIVLHDASSAKPGAREAFECLANRTGGCVMPFDAGAPVRLRDMLLSIAAYAAGGHALLKRRSHGSPSARLLLEHMPA